jgi:hypothetical protein
VKEQVEAGFSNLKVSLHLESAFRDSLTFNYQDDRKIGPTSLAIKVESPYKGTAERSVDVLIAKDPYAPFPLCLLEAKSGDDLEVRLADVHPEISENLRLRLGPWSSRLLGRMLKELADGPELEDLPF